MCVCTWAACSHSVPCWQHLVWAKVVKEFGGCGCERHASITFMHLIILSLFDIRVIFAQCAAKLTFLVCLHWRGELCPFLDMPLKLEVHQIIQIAFQLVWVFLLQTLLGTQCSTAPLAIYKRQEGTGGRRMWEGQRQEVGVPICCVKIF